MRRDTLLKIESPYQAAQNFLKVKDEDAEENGEDLLTRTLRRGAKEFATKTVFAANRIGTEKAVICLLKAYLVMDEREAHNLANWYTIQKAEKGDVASKALVDAAKMLTTGKNQVPARLATEDGFERPAAAATRLLRAAIFHKNANIAHANTFGVMAGTFVDSGLFPDDAAAIAVVEAAVAEKCGGAVGDAPVELEDGVEVEVAPVATETETPAEQPAAAPVAEEPAQPKRLSAKEKKAKAAAEAAANDPASALTGDRKPTQPKVKGKVIDSLAGLGDLDLGGKGGATA